MADRFAKALLLRIFRAALLAAIVLLIHAKHRGWMQEQALRAGGRIAVGLDTVREWFPSATRITVENRVLGADDTELGRLVQTSPASDAIIGYSGPTNTLIALGADGKALGIRVLSTGDTPEHLADVVADVGFLDSWNGLTWDALAEPREIDGVTGATLTSQAIAEGILRRAGGDAPSFRFPMPPSIEEARSLVPGVKAMDEARPGLFVLTDGSGAIIGQLARTAPFGDHLVGYGGPSDVLIALDRSGRTITGIRVRDSFDTESYVDDVRGEAYFMESFNGKTLDELAESEPLDHGIEGVSGATMTSMTVAEAIFETARVLTSDSESSVPRISPADFSTASIVLAALLIAFIRPLRGSKVVRIGFQGALVVWLGLVNGHLLSQSLFTGWAQSGVAGTLAPGLVLLAAAALIVPLVSRRQIYCHHLCPHGALQQLIKPRRRRRSLPGHTVRWLRFLPLSLLGFVIVVAMLHLEINLAGIEPFDAYLVKVAGAATVTIAIVGLVAARFIPMAYCKYGCPTGTMLDFLWAHGRPDKVSRRDAAALALFLLALGLHLLTP